MDKTSLWERFQSKLREKIGDEKMEIVNEMLKESDLDSNLLYFTCYDHNMMANMNILEGFETVCRELGIMWQIHNEPER